MVAMACLRSGRPSMDRGISPSPMALTVRLPMGRSCMSDLLIPGNGGAARSASPRRPDDTGTTEGRPKRRAAELRHHVELNPVELGGLIDRPGVGGPLAQGLAVRLAGSADIGRRD